MAKKNNASSSAVPLKLSGQSVFFGGNFYHQADAIQNRIKLEGGTVVAELTDKTDIMILGYSGVANPQKKAVKLNAQGAAIQVLTFDQFNNLIKPTPDEAVQLLLSGPQGVERWNQHADRSSGFVGHARGAGSKAYIRGADFSNADLSSANLGELVDHCDFTGANLTACHLNLAHCQLKGANLDGVLTLNLVDCTAENVDFSRIAAHHTHIESSSLTGSRFANLNQYAAQFSKCPLNGADLSGLQAPRSTFAACSIKNAILAGANLDEANFAQSDLSGANFTNANLKLAKFTGTKVDGADFTGATMVGADIAGVDFSKAKGFDPAQVEAKESAGAAVKELIKVAAHAQRVLTTLAVLQGTQAAVLSVDLLPQLTQCQDSAGHFDHTGMQHSQAASAGLWAKLATRWHGATADLASVKVNAIKSPLANKELKQLAIRAWCELFGVAAPSDEELKEQKKAAQASKKSSFDEWVKVLRTDINGVEKWNEQAVQIRTKFKDKLQGVDLSETNLRGWHGEGLNFKDGKFVKADLQKCFLHSSRLTGVDLTDADLRDAHLLYASLKNAKCQRANFAAADLSFADLCGTDLSEAVLTDAKLQAAKFDESTKFPKGFKPSLDMKWQGACPSPALAQQVAKLKSKKPLDIDAFMKRLEAGVESAKLDKALAMLKADRFKLYAQVTDDHLVGIVKSQGDPNLVYSCKLAADGVYGCCTQNLNICGGLRGSLCKHLLVLIVGLTKAGDLDPNAVDTWVLSSKGQKPALDKDAMSETFLRYKGAEAGEVDWRPTETIPEDYYAM